MKKCALVIGHSEQSPGAENKTYQVSEFVFNEKLAHAISEKTNVDIIYRNGYSNLPNQINARMPDFIISLHCNAFNHVASGAEVLYWHSSKRGKGMAEKLQRYLVDALKQPDRGIKPKKDGDRGAFLLKETHAPCIIAEPFFIDNDFDFVRASVLFENLVDAYVNFIEWCRA